MSEKSWVVASGRSGVIVRSTERGVCDAYQVLSRDAGNRAAKGW